MDQWTHDLLLPSIPMSACWRMMLATPTSERLFRLLLLGLKRTSLKSSLRSASTRGILDAEEENPLREAAAAVVAVGLKPQPPNPNLQTASVFIAEGGPSQPWLPWLYLGLDSSLPLSPFTLSSLHSSTAASLSLSPSLRQETGCSGQAGTPV